MFKKILNFYRVKEKKEERTYSPEEMERMITTTNTHKANKFKKRLEDEEKRTTKRQAEIDKYIPKAKKRKKK